MKRLERIMAAGALAATVGTGAFLVGQASRVENTRAGDPFTPHETNTQDGWNRVTDFELADGSRISLDKLSYDPATMAAGRSLDNGAVVSGDISFDGTFNTDSDALTGQITLNNSDGALMSGAYGVTAYENFDPTNTDKLIATINAQMAYDGCGLPTGCETVLENVYEGNGSFQTYTPSAEPSVEPSTMPSESPMPSASPEDLSGLTDRQLEEREVTDLETIIYLLQHGEGCPCVVCTTSSPTPSETPTATPSASPTPTAEVCPPSQDIEHQYTGWNDNGFNRELAPKENETVSRAIFQSDGAWRLDGNTAWQTSYDDKSNTAQIYVYEFDAPKTVDFSYDWGGDLQEIPDCPSADSIQQNLLASDIAKTLARPEIDSVKVTYVSADGSTRSEVLN